VEGLDIAVPIYSFAETHYLTNAQVTPAYKSLLFQLTGSVNQSPFRGFAPGEVLFLGASGSLRQPDLWELAFRFAASPNASGLTIGEITGIEKEGWDYLWVRYQETTDETAQALVQRPAAVYVERVYPRQEFSQLGIGS
ncbi:MAG: hypothetical protein KDA58_09825, partial [Planctomycetaceae bacterium]|nr:hypothetical protein [Planctomycetaceae bacterium]